MAEIQRCSTDCCPSEASSAIIGSHCRRAHRDRSVDHGQLAALEIAGPGSRSYAFIIDWQYRVLLALGWFCGAWLLIKYIGLSPGVELSGLQLQSAVAPALGIYLLYHPVLEVLMRGRTPGKRQAGVRIVARDGATPDIGALLIRNALRLVDCLPICYVLGLVSCFITEQRVRIGDLAAGTVLVLDHENAGKSPRKTRIAGRAQRTVGAAGGADS
jgi:uncharacterized RDD family membrane protein YckC